MDDCRWLGMAGVSSERTEYRYVARTSTSTSTSPCRTFVPRAGARLDLCRPFYFKPVAQMMSNRAETLSPDPVWRRLFSAELRNPLMSRLA